MRPTTSVHRHKYRCMESIRQAPAKEACACKCYALLFLESVPTHKGLKLPCYAARRRYDASICRNNCPGQRRTLWAYATRPTSGAARATCTFLRCVCYCPVPCSSMEDTSPAHLPETLSGPWQGLMMLIRCVRLACQPPCALPRHYFPRGGCKSGSWIDACAELGGRFGHLPFLLPWTTWRLPPPNSGDNRRVIYLRHCRMLLAARR